MTTTTLRAALVAFAEKHSLSPEQACTLPALFAKAAAACQVSAASLAATATNDNDALGEYLADTARKVAAEAFHGAKIHRAGGLVAVSRCTSNRAESLTDIIVRKENERSPK